MDYDQKVCRILEDLDKCVFDCLNSSHCETEDNDDSLMDEAVLPCLLMSKGANKNNTFTLPDPPKNVKVEQDVTIVKSETVTNHCNEEYILNQSDEEHLSSKQTEEYLQHESSEGFEDMRYKSDRIDVLVILENDRRKVINMKRYSKVKHLRKKFLKVIHKDPLYTEKVDEGSEIIFQTYHDKFKTWVDAEQDLILTDGMNLKVIFAGSKTQKEKESKRSYTDANSEHHGVKNHSKHKSKKLKSSVSRLEKACSRSPSPSRLQRSRSPPSRLLRSIQSYTYYEKRDHKSDRSGKSWHTSKYDFDSRRGNLQKPYMDDYSKGGKAYNGAYQVATTSYNKNRPAYNKLPYSSCSQQVNKTQSYSEELNNFLKMVEKQKSGMNEPSLDKVNEEEVFENSSQNESEEVKCEETVQSTISEASCEEVHYIILSKKEIELYRARLRVDEKHPVQAVQEICMSVYRQPPLFEIHEDRCPQTKHMRYKYTLNVLGNLFTPEKTQFNKKSAKVDAANLFLKHIGFK